MAKRPHVSATIPVFNDSGADMDANALVATDGFSTTENAWKVVLADATDSSLLAEYALVTDIPDGKKGWASREFVAVEQDTSSATADEDPIWLHPSTPGSWTTTEPATGNKQQVGSIAVYNALAGSGAVAFDIRAGQAFARPGVWPMAVYGPWAIDGDGAQTNGAGMCGATPTLTAAAAAQAKVENNAVFNNLGVAGAGYTGTYYLFPTAPVANEDYAYFGGSTKFCEIAIDMSATVATFNAAGVLHWEYWNGTTWSALTIKYDGTSGTTKDGTLSFGRDGAIVFVPPTDWAQSTVDSVTVYWVRVGIVAGKAANLTQVPRTNTVTHKIVTPTDGFLAPGDGTITAIRLNDGAGTLHTTADVKFILMNFTSGEHSGELTFAQDLRTDYWTLSTPLTVTAGDSLGVVCTQEDTAAEPSNVLLELVYAAKA